MATRPDGIGYFRFPLDAHLKTLADASLAVATAEAALEEGAHHGAAEALDEASTRLADLRAGWPSMSPSERAVLGPSAAQVRRRADAARSRVPRTSALSVGTPVSDPDEETEPS